MKNKIAFKILALIFVVMLSLVSNIYAQKSKVTDDKCLESQPDISVFPRNYDGNYRIISSGSKNTYICDFQGISHPKLNAGQYVLIIGSAESLITFTITEKGEFQSVSNSIAIKTINPKTIEFNTVEILIDPDKFLGDYCLDQYFYPSSEKPCEPRKSVFVVPDCRYTISTYGSLNDQIGFYVNKNGEISEITNLRAVFVKKETPKTLTFKNVKIQIKSLDYKGKINLLGVGKDIQVPSDPSDWITVIPSTRIIMEIPDITETQGFMIFRYFNMPESIVFIADSSSKKCWIFNFGRKSKKYFTFTVKAEFPA